MPNWKFDQLLTLLTARPWTIKSRETAASFNRHGDKVRLYKCVICIDGVDFIADNSVSEDGSGNRIEESQVAAELAVAASRALPEVAGELTTARDLLSRLIPHLPAEQSAEAERFLAGGFQADFDAPPVVRTTL